MELVAKENSESESDLEDNECVDILSSSPEQEEICSSSVNVNKFSIDNILGLKRTTSTSQILDFCDIKKDDDDEKFTKPHGI